MAPIELMPVAPSLGDDAFLEERRSECQRPVIWVRGEVRGGQRHWERVSALSRIGNAIAAGVFATAASRILVSEDLTPGSSDRRSRREKQRRSTSYHLPTGNVGALIGSERKDASFVWSEGPSALCEGEIRARWPDLKRIERIGPGLWLVVDTTQQFGKEELAARLADSLARSRRLARDGRYGEALARARQDLWLARTGLDEDDPLLADSQWTLACVHLFMDDVTSAEILLEETGELVAYQVGEDDPRYARILSDKAKAKLRKGELSAAKALLRRALDIHSEAFGREHKDRIVSLLELARVHEDEGDYTTAGPLFLEAMGTSQKVLGETHPLSIRCLAAAARTIHALGQHEDAARIYELLTKVYARVGYFYGHKRFVIDSDPLVSDMLGQGLADAAVKLIDAAIQGSEVRGFREGEDYDEHQFYQDSADCWLNFGCVSAAAGNAPLAFSQIMRAVEINQGRVRRVLSAGSERQQGEFIRRIRNDMDVLLSLVSRDFAESTKEVHAAYDVVAKRKGIEAEAASLRQQAIWHGQHSELRPELEYVLDLRRRIARALVNGPGPQSLAAHYEALETWCAEREVLEAQLGERMMQKGLHLRHMAADTARVAGTLPPGTPLMEFVRFNEFDFGAHASPARGDRWTRPQQKVSARYLVFVIRGVQRSEVGMLDLGDADRIDQMVADFRESITGTRSPGPPPSILRRSVSVEHQVGKKLREVAFEPAARLLANPARVLIAPDGDLWRLPFEVLPTSNGKRLIDELDVVYVGTGRDVERFNAAPAGEPRSSIVIADPDFVFDDPWVKGEDGASQVNDCAVGAEEVAKGVGGDNALQDETERSPRGALRERRFERLPGTREEGDYVAGILVTQCWAGATAQKGRLRSAPPPRVLHLATHGFFEPAPQERAPWGRTPVDNPLLRSGIVLAGANTFLDGGRLPRAYEDGLLTAEDVASMDLVGTELVVLSACETGLGDVRTGEGVFGLRRAFVVAGAKAVVISLWKVADEQTLELMKEFYRRVVAGEYGSVALRKARLAMREKYGDTLHWGAFVYQGDPSPLAGTAAEPAPGESAAVPKEPVYGETLDDEVRPDAIGRPKIRSKELQEADQPTLESLGWTLEKLTALSQCTKRWMRILKAELRLGLANRRCPCLCPESHPVAEGCEAGFLYLDWIRPDHLSFADVLVAHAIGHSIEMQAGCFKGVQHMRAARNKTDHAGLVDSEDRVLMPPFGIPSWHVAVVEHLLPDTGLEIGCGFREIGCDSVVFQKRHATTLSASELLRQYLAFLQAEADRLAGKRSDDPNVLNQARRADAPAVARLAAGANFACLFAREVLNDLDLAELARALRERIAANSGGKSETYLRGSDKVAGLIHIYSREFGPAFGVLAEAYTDHFVSCLGLRTLLSDEGVKAHLERLDPSKADSETRLNEIRLIGVMRDQRFADALSSYAGPAQEEADEGVNVQVAAIEALGRMGSRESILTLVGNIESDDLNTASYSSDAVEDFLWGCQDVSFLPEVLAKIADLVAHGSEDAQWRALMCLAKMVAANPFHEDLWEAVDKSLARLDSLSPRIGSFGYRLYVAALAAWPQRRRLLEHLTTVIEHVQGVDNSLKVDAFFAWCAAAKASPVDPTVFRFLPHITALVDDEGFNQGLGYGQRTANRHFCSGVADALSTNQANQDFHAGMLEIVRRSFEGQGDNRELGIELWEQIAIADAPSRGFFEYLPQVVAAFRDRDSEIRRVAVFAWRRAARANPGDARILGYLPAVTALLREPALRMQQPALCALEAAFEANPGDEKVLEPLPAVVECIDDSDLGSWALGAWTAAARVNPGSRRVLRYVSRVAECFDLWCDKDKCNFTQAAAFKAWGTAAKANPGNRQVLRYVANLGKHLPQVDGNGVEEMLGAWADSVEANPANEEILSYTPDVALHFWSRSWSWNALRHWVRAANVTPAHREILRSKELAYTVFAEAYENLRDRLSKDQQRERRELIDHWSQAATAFKDIGSPLEQLPVMMERLGDSAADVRASVIVAWERILRIWQHSEELLTHLPRIAEHLLDPDQGVSQRARDAWEAAAKKHEGHVAVEATRELYESASSHV